MLRCMVCIVAYFRLLRCMFYACFACLCPTGFGLLALPYLALLACMVCIVAQYFVLWCKYRVFFVAWLAVWPVCDLCGLLCFVLHDGLHSSTVFCAFVESFILLCFGAFPLACFGLLLWCCALVLSLWLSLWLACASLCPMGWCFACVCVCLSLCVFPCVSFHVALLRFAFPVAFPVSFPRYRCKPSVCFGTVVILTTCKKL